MATSALVGARIRERRSQLGLRQAALAKSCGISPSYLNLIEHNRRNIGGKLLSEIAVALETDVTQLRAGAEALAVDAMLVAANGYGGVGAELDRAEDLAARHPGWARLIGEQGRRIRSLERSVASLTDRMGHDPVMSDAMHNITSTITGIHSAIGILSDASDVDPEWQARFLRNVREDSERLTKASRELAAQLDAGPRDDEIATLPEDQLLAWLEARKFRVAALEKGWSLDAALHEAKGDLSHDALTLARPFLERYARDVAAVPREPLEAAIANAEPDPAALARHFGVPLSVVFRRLATLEETPTRPAMALATCDQTGAIGLRKSIDGFPVRRFGAHDRLWPLHAALSRPMAPIREQISAQGRYDYPFTAYAVCDPVGQVTYDRPPRFEVTMLVVPVQRDA